MKTTNIDIDMMVHTKFILKSPYYFTLSQH